MTSPEYVGNLVPAPGYYVTGTVEFDEILYSTARFTEKGVTLAPGQGIVGLGQVMSQQTDRTWVPYTGATGQVPSGVLRRSVDTGSDSSATAKRYLGNIVISGILKRDKLTGMTATAVSEMNARDDATLGIVVL